jgi:hypothetical protein
LCNSPVVGMQRSYERTDSESFPSESTQSGETSTASKRYVSAPFLLQRQLGRRAPVSELVVVDTPPSCRTNQTLQAISPPLQLKGNQAMLLSPIRESPPSQEQRTNALRVDLPHTLALNNVNQREDSAYSSATAQTSNDYTPLTNASAPSLPYTWTDSYLDESPEATKARWIQRQTFGPVLQSEGGNSSTVVSTPRCPRQDAEAVWGGVLARNEKERGGRQGMQLPSDDDDGDGGDSSSNKKGNTTSRAGAACHAQRRFNIEAAERGGEGLGRSATQQQQNCVGETPSSLLPHAPRASLAAKTLFPGSEPKHLISDASTVIATVQQPRRTVQVTPVEKSSPPPQQQRQRSTDAFFPPPQSGPTRTYGNNNNNLYLSTSATLLPSAVPINAPELRASRDIAQTRSPGAASRADASGPVSSRSGKLSHSSSTGEILSLSDAGDSSTNDLTKAGDGQACRNGLLRRRVLKPIYDD